MKLFIIVLLVALTAAPAQAVSDHAVLVRADPIYTLSPGQVRDFLTPIGVYIPQASSGVDAYRITYRTGRSTATAFVVLPVTQERRLRPAVWLHGTQSYRHDAPSVSECCDRAAGILFASIGYATTVPDYIGLGDGPGTHPYFQAETMVSASMDAMRATKELARQHGHTVGGPAVISGFSQGANGSLLLARALQHAHVPLGAVAPISGAYNLFGIEWLAALDGKVESKAATYYLAYITVAWNRLYHLYGNESEVFKMPVSHLFDGEHTLDETMVGLPSTPAELLQESYIEQLRHPTGRLRWAAFLNDNACLYWTPAIPVRMYAAHGDPEAVYANSEWCKERFGGTDTTLTDVGDVDHITSLVLSVPHVAAWFSQIR